MFVNSKFPNILDGTGFSEAALEFDPAIIFVVDSDFRIVYCNRAWDAFARQNDGNRVDRASVLGTNWIDVIPGPLRNFYSDGVAEVHLSGKVWEHDFECSSAELHRRFHMRVLPLPEFHLLIENSSRVETTHAQEPDTDTENFTYVNRFGIVTMCSHCRRARRADPDQHKFWDWIPLYVSKSPDPVSHGLCPTCCAYFYGAGSKDFATNP